MRTYFYLFIFLCCFSLYNFHGGHIDENEIVETSLSRFLVRNLQSFSKYNQANIGAFIISSASIPIFILLLIFRIKSEGALSIFSSFAAGALIGDVFIHNLQEIFIPEHEHNHEEHKEHNHKAPNGFINKITNKEYLIHSFFQNEMLICWGVLVLFIIEKFMTYFSNNKENEIEEENSKNKENTHSHTHSHSHSHSHNNLNTSNITISLLGDFIHNLTDGMAIGAGFNKSLKLGITLSLSIFFHEIPHEVGDFSYLLKQNLNVWSTLLSQVLSASGAFVGVYLSFIIGEKYSDKIISFASGAFLYLAINTIMGDLKHSKGIFYILLEGFAFIFGVFVLNMVI
ncbi:MAG: ZIP family metal transporter [archaeon]|nr:ZIP family metal transporter [archaeon]